MEPTEKSEGMYLFLNYETNKEKQLYAFLNYGTKEDDQMYSFSSACITAVKV
jgi:hypothetical protein